MLLIVSQWVYEAQRLPPPLSSLARGLSASWPHVRGGCVCLRSGPCGAHTAALAVGPGVAPPRQRSWFSSFTNWVNTVRILSFLFFYDQSISLLISVDWLSVLLLSFLFFCLMLNFCSSCSYFLPSVFFEFHLVFLFFRFLRWKLTWFSASLLFQMDLQRYTFLLMWMQLWPHSVNTDTPIFIFTQFKIFSKSVILNV